ncbi:hypothetical protein O6H91_08G078900 [Diphasiastrum complanatum]|uniref:Uncharacterized protein n=6 Tax=Diphasiastrum complanatum TaxID=34168 RepID=A0ACC2CZ92_DIPCM|nr:hypothetical protein O6H91_08G078600 [Diphasiastrum complanatum]KAJ7547290.1 hypothetical protein O6H91_08G078600 [Diphasiastrum complanatum]KAJ7547291.1 hypothetical protein O6H91_08G078600 [Diphasiastrum complanatum]KAJ7547295.1 hypothetical protein O6H91_08G078900 [Diphasiastrum complanatum]KAJ7547296.1 hypothetical protein O6H91_08G078900 [Diphasiastrum complanatum]
MASEMLDHSSQGYSSNRLDGCWPASSWEHAALNGGSSEQGGEFCPVGRIDWDWEDFILFSGRGGECGQRFQSNQWGYFGEPASLIRSAGASQKGAFSSSLRLGADGPSSVNDCMANPEHNVINEEPTMYSLEEQAMGTSIKNNASAVLAMGNFKESVPQRRCETISSGCKIAKSSSTNISFDNKSFMCRTPAEKDPCSSEENYTNQLHKIPEKVQLEKLSIHLGSKATPNYKLATRVDKEGSNSAAAFPIGLKLGKRTYFEDGVELGVGQSTGLSTNSSGSSSPTASGKKHRSQSQGATAVPRCQVEGCRVDLSNMKDYHRRHKVCEMHAKAPKGVVAGQEQRFCQQCSRFQILTEFDEGKRSCRRRLAVHNERRRKPHPDTLTSAGDSYQAYKLFGNGMEGSYIIPQPTNQLSAPGRLDIDGSMRYNNCASTASKKYDNCNKYDLQAQVPLAGRELLDSFFPEQQAEKLLMLSQNSKRDIQPLPNGLAMQSAHCRLRDPNGRYPTIAGAGILPNLESTPMLQNGVGTCDVGGALSLLSSDSWVPRSFGLLSLDFSECGSPTIENDHVKNQTVFARELIQKQVVQKNTLTTKDMPAIQSQLHDLQGLSSRREDLFGVEQHQTKSLLSRFDTAVGSHPIFGLVQVQQFEDSQPANLQIRPILELMQLSSTQAQGSHFSLESEKVPQFNFQFPNLHPTKQ